MLVHLIKDILWFDFWAPSFYSYVLGTIDEFLMFLKHSV